MQGRLLGSLLLLGSSSWALAQATLEVRTDQPCNLVVNGSPQGQLSAGVPITLQTGAGAQWIECSTAAGKARRELTVAADSHSVVVLRASLIGRFRDQGNGIIADQKTGFQWTASDNAGDIGWAAADRYCRELDLAGPGWRLPTVAELEQIYDGSGTLTVPCQDLRCEVDPAFRLTGSWYWSSDLSDEDASLAWYLAFHQAGRGSASLSAEQTGRALCVRPPPPPR